MLDDDNEFGIDESAVLTLAEFFYEQGFSSDQAAAMAWAVAKLPYLISEL